MVPTWLKKFLNGPASFRDLFSSYLAQSSYLVRNNNLHAKNAELRKTPDLIVQQRVQFQEQRRNQVKAKPEKLEDPITNPNTPVSSGEETKQSSKTKLKKDEKEASKSKEVPNGKTKVTVRDSSAKVGPNLHPVQRERKE